MSRTNHAISTPSASRRANLRKLITMLIERPHTRDEIIDALKMSPSGVRQYLKDLAGQVEMVYIEGAAFHRLAVTVDQARACLASLLVAPARATPNPRSALLTAARQPGRRFHILDDDAPYQVRVLRAIPEHDPVHAAFFGAAAVSVQPHTAGRA